MWAPVPSSDPTCALFAVAAADDWTFHHLEVTTVFLNAKMDKGLYIKLSDGAEPESADEVCR